jgi:hypothetical protein
MMDKPVRSQFPSIKLDQLVYVELESSNGGMMLSVSEEGFSFRAVTPVRPSGKIRFSFVINGAEKLEGYGKVEWTQEDGKVAGLQFTDVTTEFLSALRNWLAQMSAPAVPSFSDAHSDTLNTGPQRVSESPKAPALEPVMEPRVQHRTELGSTSPQPLDPARPNNRFVAVSPREIPQSEVRGTMPVLSEWEFPKGLQDHSRPPIHGVAAVAVVICFVALAILLYDYHQAVGHSLISLGQKISATPEASPSQPLKVSDAPKAPIESQQPLTSANSEKGQDRTSPQPLTPANSEKEQDRTSPQSELITDSRYHPESIPSPTKTESRVRDTRTASTPGEPWVDEPRSHNPVEQARSLWSAVAQGNTSAEVALAKLYLIGGGVTKNCDQARVLLKAAAKKGNGEAIDKLFQIEHQGCP